MNARKICQVALKRWGYAEQVTRAIEAMGNLTLTLLGFRTGSMSHACVCDEIAATQIRLDQVAAIFGWSMTEDYRKEKLQWLANYLDKDPPNMKPIIPEPSSFQWLAEHMQKEED